MLFDASGKSSVLRELPVGRCHSEAERCCRVDSRRAKAEESAPQVLAADDIALDLAAAEPIPHPPASATAHAGGESKQGGHCY